MKARILWVEGKRAESPSFIPGVKKKGYSIETVVTGNEALARLSDFDPDLVLINIPSMRTTGKRIVRSLREKAKGVPLLVILENGQPSAGLPADAILVLPFTVRKLLNRIVPLLPGDGGDLLHVGPIRLDMQRKRVRCQGREATLTPRMAVLLKTFMEHAGEALERERLFREVWNTEYTADTRTLDVHISWLREAIEENPRHPRFLKTIRGVGYRLDA
jgi:DNA-binding response OmpR family regulator